jgi:hypothetical protein
MRSPATNRCPRVARAVDIPQHVGTCEGATNKKNPHEGARKPNFRFQHNDRFNITSDDGNRVNGGSFSFLERMEGAMAQVCYSIKRDSIGWVIWASGDAVLICKEKRIAINTARYAGRLLFVDGGSSRRGTEPRVCLTERRGAPAIAATA